MCIPYSCIFLECRLRPFYQQGGDDRSYCRHKGKHGAAHTKFVSLTFRDNLSQQFLLIDKDGKR